MAAPRTSRAAYARTRPYSDSQRRDVLLAINAAMNAGRGGATTDEVEVATGIIHQSASAAMNGLKSEGTVETFGMTRPTRTGNQAEVYRLAGMFRDAAAPTQKPLL